MNQQQRKYATERVYSIAQTKKEEVRQRFTTESKRLSATQRFTAFKKGKYQIRPDVTSIYTYTDVIQLLQFDGDVDGGVDTEKSDPICKEISKRASKVVDEIMLGDAEEALALLKSFSEEQY